MIYTHSTTQTEGMISEGSQNTRKKRIKHTSTAAKAVWTRIWNDVYFPSESISVVYDGIRTRIKLFKPYTRVVKSRNRLREITVPKILSQLLLNWDCSSVVVIKRDSSVSNLPRSEFLIASLEVVLLLSIPCKL